MAKTWVDGNTFVEAITENDIKEELYGSKSVHAKYTAQIKWINEQLKADAGKWSKPGRPRKIKADNTSADDQGLAMGR